MMIYPMFSLILPPLLFLPLIFSRESSKEENEAFRCHASQLANLSSSWKGIFIDTDKKQCMNNTCVLMWGLTTDKRTRILAQGCSKGPLYIPDKNGPKMKNECPNGGGIGARGEPILMGEEGEAILRTLTHIQICLCVGEWCNAPRKEDGESCDGDESPFCNPISPPNNYSIEAIPPSSAFHNQSEDSTLDDYGKSEEMGWIETLKGFTPILVILLMILAVIVLVIALLRMFACIPKHDQDSIELLGYQDSKRGYRHTSARLNSIAQVTILTEVAQGYKQEGEELIRESQAGGIHQIANWKYDGAVVLGEGSFGAVYKVDMKPEYLVDVKVAALKTFNHMKSTHFFNESRTLKYVHDFKNHPNIIQYLGRAVDCRDTLEEATWRIALELCEGGCLRDWITSTKITLTQYLEAANSILSALSFLHCEESVQTSLLSNFRGNSIDSGNPDSRCNSRSRRSSERVAPFKRKFRIAHCDINSRNILVRNPITGNVVLADFGLSLTDKEKRQEEVQIREIGTIRYLSPEMLQSLINLSDALGSLILADTYATGLVLWELLSRTVEVYDDDSEMPDYLPPYEKELNEIKAETANRFEAMLNVVVRRGCRPSWGGKAIEWKEREEEALSRDEDNHLTDEERFLYSSMVGINWMLARDPDARLTIPAMAEKVDTYRLQRIRLPERRARSREDSLLDETSGSN
ncbi:hypothetical protein PMAYCL1PPCAC_18550 [Pristionchus mayeri]|uniref:receptor protein serine/threonine kinase n=1 Tax=Pristionchus mayeri TaxID=1317129 RepID=A0AAN5CQ32_9BILA|nr:hypothetical protein PMAYCL1PPCAC_18550 [Pristionchus mayeri]